MTENILVDNGESKFEIEAMTVLDRSLEDVAVNGEQILIVIDAAFESDVEIPLAEIRLIIFVILNRPQSGKGREVADRVGDKGGDDVPIPLE